MAFPDGFSRNDLEKAKFRGTDETDVCVEVCSTELKDAIDAISTGGVLTSGTQSVVALTTSWTAVTALADRNLLVLQNQSDDGTEILVNYTGSGSDGWRIRDGDWRSQQVSDAFDIYVRAKTGTATVLIDQSKL